MVAKNILAIIIMISFLAIPASAYYVNINLGSIIPQIKVVEVKKHVSLGTISGIITNPVPRVITHQPENNFGELVINYSPRRNYHNLLVRTKIIICYA
jgi:hypothetical protein